MYVTSARKGCYYKVTLYSCHPQFPYDPRTQNYYRVLNQPAPDMTKSRTGQPTYNQGSGQVMDLVISGDGRLMTLVNFSGF